MNEALLAYRAADTTEELLDATVGDVLRAAAARTPDLIAVVEGAPAESVRRTLTYAQLMNETEQVARALLARFRPGEHVAVWSGNSLEWVLLEYGAGLAGLVLVTVNPAYRADELRHVLSHSRSVGLLHMSSFRGNPMAATVAEVREGLPTLREVIVLDEWAGFVASGDSAITLPTVRPSDNAQIQYTSGTTGFPKGVLLRHRGVVNNGRLTMRRLGIRSGDVLVWPMPLFHTAGCVMGVLGAVTTCATLVLVTQFDPGLLLELAESYRATMTGGVPTMVIALLRHPECGTRDLSSLRLVVSGGAPVPIEVAKECEQRFGVPSAVVFGTTECSCIVTATRPDDPPEVRTATLGTALPHVEVMIADLVTGQPVPTDMVGELCARGPLVMRGYFDDPKGTEAAIDTARWYHTGDLAAMDAGGCLRVEGRTKDMIIRGGENIYPREIEDLLHAHPAVAEVAVVGRPDPVWGETVAAFVRLSEDAATGDELADYCRAHLAAYKTPITWAFVDEFPVTASGKVRKNVLRDRLVAGGRH